MTALIEALTRGPRVLDGGLGTLLESRGHDLGSSLWSARMLLDQPEVVRAAHAEFFAAGAEIAISASYQVSYERLHEEGLDRRAVDGVLQRSVQLAREARDHHGSGWVAASVGPYGAMLADGSEYRGDYGLSVDELRAWHRPRLTALVDAAPDLLAVETIPSLAEVEAVVAEVAGRGVPAWISVTVSGGALRSGESLAEAFAVATSAPEVIAVGVNCCDPAEVAPAAATARATTALPFVAYPNSGEQWDAKNRRWMGHPGFAEPAVQEWLDAGVQVLGGCCRVGPAQIATLAAQVRGASD